MSIQLPLAERNRLNAAYMIADTAGLLNARKQQQAALNAYEEALGDKRKAEDVVRVCQADHDDHVAVLQYQLAGRFATKANKQYLDDGDRSFTADEKKQWIASETARDDDARALASNLRAAVSRLEEARDRIAICERRISAVKADISAAVALVDLLTACAFTNHNMTEERHQQ